MSNFNPEELKWYALIFGVILLIVFIYRKATKKVISDREKKAKAQSAYRPVVSTEKPAMTEEQFTRSWKSLSYLLLLAGAGNLYMAYNAVTKAIQAGGLWVWWVDFAFSIIAAGAAVMIWRKKTKNWIFVYFAATLVPLFLFMSIQGQVYKISALIHLFPLVLLYFVLKPVWSYLKTE